MMKCQNENESLSLYVDGRLAPREEAKVRAHLQTCERCKSEVESLRGTIQLLSRFENHQLSKSFESRLFQRLDALGGNSRRAPAHAVGSPLLGQLLSPGHWFHSHWRWVATATAAAALGLASWQLTPGPTAAPATSSTPEYITACVQAHASYTAPQPVRATAAPDINPDADIAIEGTE